jgi:hypothetical protein
MTSASPAAAIEARLRAGWTTSPIFVENGNAPGGGFKAPVGLDGKPLPFVVLEFPGGVSDIMDIGASVYREDGAFMIHINVVTGTGTEMARAWADTIAAIFRGKRFSFVLCYAPYPPAPSSSPDGKYYRMSFGTPYHYEFVNS